MNHFNRDIGWARQLQHRLHDGVGQCLSLAAMQIDRAQAVPESDALQRTRTLVHAALDELRSVMAGIGEQVAGSNEPDLPGRLNACVKQLNARQPTPVSCTIEGSPLQVSAHACDILLGATQELLVNACKHGQAAGVDARLFILPHRLSITVTERHDDTDRLPWRLSHSPGQGLGLGATRQRLSLIGARLRWRHSASGGVDARISWVPRS
jgi:signal transduction histidine kinase